MSRGLHDGPPVQRYIKTGFGIGAPDKCCHGAWDR
jgi:hypothetical protein